MIFFSINFLSISIITITVVKNNEELLGKYAEEARKPIQNNFRDVVNNLVGGYRANAQLAERDLPEEVKEECLREALEQEELLEKYLFMLDSDHEFKAIEFETVREDNSDIADYVNKCYEKIVR